MDDDYYVGRTICGCGEEFSDNVEYTYTKCRVCDGRGEVWSVGCGDGTRTCNNCDGAGYEVKERTCRSHINAPA